MYVMPITCGKFLDSYLAIFDGRVRSSTSICCQCEQEGKIDESGFKNLHCGRPSNKLVLDILFNFRAISCDVHPGAINKNPVSSVLSRHTPIFQTRLAAISQNRAVRPMYEEYVRRSVKRTGAPAEQDQAPPKVPKGRGYSKT